MEIKWRWICARSSQIMIIKPVGIFLCKVDGRNKAKNPVDWHRTSCFNVLFLAKYTRIGKRRNNKMMENFFLGALPTGIRTIIIFEDGNQPCLVEHNHQKWIKIEYEKERIHWLFDSFEWNYLFLLCFCRHSSQQIFNWITATCTQNHLVTPLNYRIECVPS